MWVLICAFLVRLRNFLDARAFVVRSENSFSFLSLRSKFLLTTAKTNIIMTDTRNSQSPPADVATKRITPHDDHFAGGGATTKYAYSTHVPRPPTARPAQSVKRLGYVPDGPVSESRQGRKIILSSKPPRPAPEPTQSRIHYIPGFFPSVQAVRS
jgi:hypothetical protein